MVFLPHWPKRTKLAEQIVLGTERVQQALDHLGNPEKRLPAVIHVTGTNGKGSTVAYIAQILQDSAYKVHTFTSPHLLDFNERITLCGHKISDERLFQVMEACRIVVEQHSILLTLFECTTVGALLAFAEEPADFLVLEVGMGGRCDATNVVERPLVSVITSISHDHNEFLGDTLEAIAYEKAGIIKSGCPCVVGAQQTDNVVKLLAACAEELASPAMIYGRDWTCVKVNDSTMHFESELFSGDFPLPALRGEHQVYNAGNAIATFALLQEKHGLHIRSARLPAETSSGLCWESIASGLRRTYWPARLELVTASFVRSGLPAAWEVYLDGGHNTGCAEVLAQWAASHQDGAPLYLVLGMTKGKNVAEFLGVLKNQVKFVCGVCVQRELNAQRGEAISEQAAALGIPTQAFDYLPSAIDHIVALETAPKVRILICGSLYLAADVKKLAQGLLV